MNRMLRPLVLGVLALAVIVTFYRAFGEDPQLMEKGKAAPDFTLQTVDGKPLTLSDLRGQAVVLNFWATWCPPCRREMPALQAAYEAYREKGVVVVGVNFGESRATVRGFLSRHGVTFPVVLDQDQNITTKVYGVKTFPTTVLIDSRGMVQAIHVGELNRQLIDRYLASLLSRS
ncbi:MAG TPA: thiol-disulfide oxidoreductase ResA [Calditerricola sp.]